MPTIPDTTPARTLRIRRGGIQYFVSEEKYDTVQIEEDGGAVGTYKSLGYEIVSAIENGEEVAYVKREHVGNVPGRSDVAAEQIGILQANDQPVPASLERIAGVAPVDPAPADPPEDDPQDDATASETRRPSRKTSER